MLVRSAEESFDLGMTALHDGRDREALAFFEAAIELERRLGKGSPQARYLSQYGLCLGTVARKPHEGIRFCREAVSIEGYNPDLQWNLGRALNSAGRRKEAHLALVQGLRLQPNHAGIVQELRRMGVRKRPVIPFLSRDNALNVILGRMRAERRRKKLENKRRLR